MSALAPTMQAFFTERLVGQRQTSAHTIAAYRDAFRLLLVFAQQRTGIEPHALDIDDLDAALVTAFLDHLERDRGNNPRTRKPGRKGSLTTRAPALRATSAVASVLALSTTNNSVSYANRSWTCRRASSSAASVAGSARASLNAGRMTERCGTPTSRP
jgi:site-specific recombinase XerC